MEKIFFRISVFILVLQSISCAGLQKFNSIQSSKTVMEDLELQLRAKKEEYLAYLKEVSQLPLKMEGNEKKSQSSNQSGLVISSVSRMNIDASKIDKDIWRKRTMSELKTFQQILDRLEKYPDLLDLRPKAHEIANYFVIMNGRVQEGRVEKLPQLFQKIELAMNEMIEKIQNQKK